MIVAPRLVIALFALAAASSPSRAADDPRLIPKPREVTAGELVPLPKSVAVTGANGEDDRFAAKDLAETLKARGIRVITGADAAFRISLLRLDTPGAKRTLEAASLSFADDMKAEGYVLVTTKDGAVVVANSAAGIFYGVQTLKQLIRTDGAAPRIQLAVVRDWPAMKYRGFHDDLSRGPVPTLEFQKKEIRTFAAYKLNVYSPYFEHTLSYDANPLISPPGGGMSHDDVRALVAYAKRYHVDIVPEQEAFGHLHHVLKYDLYAPLGETDHGHVLAPGDPASLPLIKSWFAEIDSLFPSKFVHLGADETFELGMGRTKGRVSQERARPGVHRFPEADRERAALHRQALPLLGRHRAGQSRAREVAPEGHDRRGLGIWRQRERRDDCFVRSSTQAWRHGSRRASAGGAASIRTTTSRSRTSRRWRATVNASARRDSSTRAGPTTERRSSTSSGTASCSARRRAGRRASRRSTISSGVSACNSTATRAGRIDAAQMKLSAAHALLAKGGLGDGSDYLYWVDPYSAEGQLTAQKMRVVSRDVRVLAESAMVLVAQARQVAKGKLRETDALESLEMGARRMDFIGMKFELSDEISRFYTHAYDTVQVGGSPGHDLGEITSNINARTQDLRDGYVLGRELYEKSWLAQNKPYWLYNVLEAVRPRGADVDPAGGQGRAGALGVGTDEEAGAAGGDRNSAVDAGHSVTAEARGKKGVARFDTMQGAGEESGMLGRKGEMSRMRDTGTEKGARLT